MRGKQDITRGLYRKFTVTRTDGKSAKGKKHEHCKYFVLDLTHDEFAHAALHRYAQACWDKFPALAQDIDAILDGYKTPLRKLRP